MANEPLQSVQEPADQAAKMNMQTFIILVAILVIVGAFVAYVSKTIAGESSTAAPMPKISFDPATGSATVDEPPAAATEEPAAAVDPAAATDPAPVEEGPADEPTDVPPATDDASDSE